MLPVVFLIIITSHVFKNDQCCTSCHQAHNLHNDNKSKWQTIRGEI